MKLKIHIGHGKTGSSYLQAAFASSESLLEKSNIFYPLAPEIREKALAGKVTSGNINPLDLATTLDQASYSQDDTLLLSNENLFQGFSSGEAISEITQRVDPSNVSAILFARNPLENAASSWLQAVKKAHIDTSFDDVLEKFTRPLHVARVIKNCRAAGVDLQIWNYSEHRKDLVGVTEDWLGVERGHLILPRNTLVNRSLSVGEAELQRRINATLPAREAVKFSQFLSENVAKVDSNTPKVGRDVLDRFFARTQKQISEVHDLLGYEIYTKEDFEPYVLQGEEKYYLSEAHFDRLAELIQRWYKSGRAPSN